MRSLLPGSRSRPCLGTGPWDPETRAARTVAHPGPLGPRDPGPDRESPLGRRRGSGHVQGRKSRLCFQRGRESRRGSRGSRSLGLGLPRPRPSEAPAPSPDSAAPSTGLTKFSAPKRQVSGLLLLGARCPCPRRECPTDPATSLSGGSGTSPAVQPPGVRVWEPGVGLEPQLCLQRTERRAERLPHWPCQPPGRRCGVCSAPPSRRRCFIVGVASQRNGDLACV